ncbi:hypothetical protein BC829DRAFT_394770 [Chytridium lagenaria]|nr:hypothetical protein BC829DRAFT_394770 [Chytridium lagenaria]
MLDIVNLLKPRQKTITTVLLTSLLPFLFAKLGIWPFALILGKKKKTLAAADKVYDYVVVGGGSAGCAVASRLSEDEGVTVCLIEAGGNGMKDSSINTPLLFSTTQETGKDWKDLTVRQPLTRNRVHYWPRGRVLGGCSSVNAMLYVRGAHNDYNRWESEHGCEGWGYDKLKHYFEKMEGCEIDEDELDKDHHGRDGPLKVSRSTRGNPVPITHLFVEGCMEAGIGKRDRYKKDSKGRIVGVDINGDEQYGACVSQVPKYRKNLTVVTDVMAVRLVYDQEGQETTRVKGVAVWAEVVLSCGAINTPKLLMLSGIGPSSELDKFHIPIVQSLPGVGSNLRDHLCVGVSRQDFTNSVYRTTPGAIVKALLEYQFFKSGMLSCSGVEGYAFLNVNKDGEEERHGQPDMQLHLIGISVEGEQANKMRLQTRHLGPIDPTRPDAHDPAEASLHVLPTLNPSLPGPYISIAPTILHPRSTGTIRLSSAHASTPPLIDPQYLSRDDDVDTLRMEKIRPGAIGGEVVDRGVVLEVMRVLGCGEGEAVESDLYLRELVRRGAVTLYHPVGTCKMGPRNDPMSVVDPRTLKVHGISNLRIADASVMPTLVSGNTNAPAIMVGEVCADMMRGRF